MCHTTTTYLICLHTVTSTTKCTAASGYLIPGFYSFLLHPPKCNRTSSKNYTDAFCPPCTSLFHLHSINEEETRAKILRYRERNEYYGPLTPFTNIEGAVGFVKEGIPTQPIFSPANGNKAQKSDVDEEDTTSQEYLDAWWGSSLGSELNNEVKDDDNEFDRIIHDAKPKSKRSSTSSTCTLWPGPRLGSANADASDLVSPSAFTSTEGARRSSEADIGIQRLDTLGLLEVDEFGAEIEIPVPLPAYFSRDGLIHPDAFELKNLEIELPGLTNWEGFERQRVTKPPQPIPKETPQRKGSDGRKLC
jgi:hypothetical protein